jgi:hypothetical protein
MKTEPSARASTAGVAVAGEENSKGDSKTAVSYARACFTEIPDKPACGHFGGACTRRLKVGAQGKQMKGIFQCCAIDVRVCGQTLQL